MEAACYHQEKDRFICDICPVHCSLSEGQVSVCQGRQVVDGKLQAINYGQVVALHLDPIEKKPLYHVMPGSEILSVGANGCNLHCQWCQNCEISQGTVVTRFMAPEEIAQAGVRSPSVGIAYTYTEPFIWYETLRDTIPLVHALGGINVLVTNGFVEKEPLEALLPYIDAANVDLKFLDDELYKKYTGGRLPTVQHTIARMVESGVHVEITHLMVSGLVEPLEHIRKLSAWIASVNRKIPLHLSRYFPRYKWDQPQTLSETMIEAVTIAKETLDYVYLGNLGLPFYSDTICPACDSQVVQRFGYSVNHNGLSSEGLCRNCGEKMGFLIATR